MIVRWRCRAASAPRATTRRNRSRSRQSSPATRKQVLNRPPLPKASPLPMKVTSMAASSIGLQHIAGAAHRLEIAREAGIGSRSCAAAASSARRRGAARRSAPPQSTDPRARPPRRAVAPAPRAAPSRPRSAAPARRRDNSSPRRGSRRKAPKRSSAAPACAGAGGTRCRMLRMRSTSSRGSNGFTT